MTILELADFTSLLQGDARLRLAELPKESVNCMVTSPPYWGLRKYAGEQELIWGGTEGCQHKWGAVLQSSRHDHTWATSSPAETVPPTQYETVKQGAFCSLCGAWKGAFGNEPSVEMYVQHSIEILREIRRVLRSDGTVWWNVGDAMASGKGTCFNPGGGENSLEGHAHLKDEGAYPLDRGSKATLKVDGLKPLDACLIPFRMALAAQADGWYVRMPVVWEKDNPMPESVNGWHWEQHRIKIKNEGRGKEASRNTTEGRPQQDHDGRDFAPDATWVDCPGCPKCLPNDGLVLRKGAWRPTDAHEFILMLTKTDDYYGDREAVKEPQTGNAHSRGTEAGNAAYQEARGSYKGFHSPNVDVGGRNLRSVWSFPTQPSKVKHFAVFPEELVKRCVLASCPPYVCPKCQKPWARVLEKGLTAHDGTTASQFSEGSKANRLALLRQAARERGKEYVNETKTLGWKATCNCGLPQEQCIPGTVLDPFVGSGTTCAVAQSLGRRSIGIDLSAEYLELARKRIEASRPPLFPVEDNILGETP